MQELDLPRAVVGMICKPPLHVREPHRGDWIVNLQKNVYWRTLVANPNLKVVLQRIPLCNLHHGGTNLTHNAHI